MEIECEWTARRRERKAGRLCSAVHYPTQAKTGLEWATARFCEGRGGSFPLIADRRSLY